MIKGARTAFDMKNQRTISDTEVDISAVNTKMEEYDNHVATANTVAHVISNVNGLDTELSDRYTKTESDVLLNDRYTKAQADTLFDAKQDVITGYTGDIVVVIGVDFTAETVSTSTITYVDGIATGIV